MSQMLSKYLYMLEQLNPGKLLIYIFVMMTPSSIATSLLLMRKGISCMATCVVIDTTHLKGKYKDVMFIASTKDANEQIVPLAFGVGDKENDLSWDWFLEHIL